MCPCCMQEHEIHTVQIKDENIFKGEKVEFDAIYEYCDQADELYSTEEMMSENDISMKNAYRKMKGMLTSDEIFTQSTRLLPFYTTPVWSIKVFIFRIANFRLQRYEYFSNEMHNN